MNVLIDMKCNKCRSIVRVVFDNADRQELYDKMKDAEIPCPACQMGITNFVGIKEENTLQIYQNMV